MFRRKHGTQRRAAAVVEMAVVTPLLCTLLFGIIEYGWVFSVRQSLTNAAREGARTAALAGSTEQDVRDRVAEYLAPYGLTTYTLTLTRATQEEPTETVRLQIPYRDVTLLGGFFGNMSSTLGSTCSMRKEGFE